MPFFYYYDPYYWMILVPAMLIALLAQLNVSSTFNRYSRMASRRGFTGAQAAEAVLRAHGIQNVRIERVSGRLTDHYDPRSNVIRLSDAVYGSNSIASVGVAAHEAGHAVQYAVGYGPIKLRSALVPICNIGSQLSLILIVIGLLLYSQPLFGVGVLLTGKSGVGKSETAMELIKRGHRLIADDSVLIREITNELYGSAPDMIRYFMELRGIGIINAKSMYGSGSVLDEKKIDMEIEMERWQEGKEYDRVGDEGSTEEILGVKIPKIVIPVSPGRNLAIIIEVAARNFRLKSMGYDAAEELISKSIGR